MGKIVEVKKLNKPNWNNQQIFTQIVLATNSKWINSICLIILITN